MTTFNKAITTLLRGDEAAASTLFSQYVVEQATKIQKSITEDFDLDDIVDSLGSEDDEDFGNLDDPDFLDESTDVNADPDESPEALAAIKEGKTFRQSGDDEEDSDAQERFERDRQRDNSRNQEEIHEGRLVLSQEENGDLTVTHSGNASAVAVDTAVEVESQVQPEQFTSLDSLRESFELELAAALVQLEDGKYANGENAHVNTKSTVGDRSANPTTMKVGKGQHSGFALEQSPKVEGEFVGNSLEHASDTLEPVKKGGDPKAALNAWGDDKSAVTPVPKK